MLGPILSSSVLPASVHLSGFPPPQTRPPCRLRPFLWLQLEGFLCSPAPPDWPHSYLPGPADRCAREAPGHHLWSDGRRSGASGAERSCSFRTPPASLTSLYTEKSSTARTGAEEATAAKMRCGNWGEVVSWGRGLGPLTFYPVPLTPRPVPPSVYRTLVKTAVESSWGGGCGERVFLSPEIGTPRSNLPHPTRPEVPGPSAGPRRPGIRHKSLRSRPKGWRRRR